MGVPAHDPARLAGVIRQGGEPAVAALLEAHGVALHEYFRLMLGDETATIRALTDTIVAALAHVDRLTDPRRLRAWLLALARVNAHEFYPAGWDSAAERYLGALRGRPAAPEAGDQALAVITEAALLRMWPEEREVFIIGAPRYQVHPAELAAIFGLADEQQAAEMVEEAAGSFWRAFERSASEARFGLSAEAQRRAPALIGASPVAVTLSQILPFCTDPGLARLREDISSRTADLGIDGFPVTFNLSWPGREPVGTGQDAWPAAGRTRDRRRMLLTAAVGTAIVAGVGVPGALLAATVFASPPVRGAPAQAAIPATSPAVPAATQSPDPTLMTSPAAGTTSAAPARTTPAPSRSPQPSRTTPSPSPSPTRPGNGNNKSPSPSPSAATTPPSPAPSPSPTRRGNG